MILDTQELAASREKERQLRHDMTKLQTDLDKERLKNKTIADKVESISMNHIRGTTNQDHISRHNDFCLRFHFIQVTRDNQQITSLELKMATLKSRVSELEGSLSFAQENTNKVRQQALFDQERLTTIMKEVSRIFTVFWEVHSI